jgi:fructosamine-3-kinase
MADPPESLLKWAASALGAEATVESVTGLHDGSSPWRLRVVGPAATTEAILRTSFDPPRWQGGPGALRFLARSVAALRVAEQHGLDAPRLIACDLNGHVAGQPGSLETVLPGNGGWPELPSAAGWRDAGAAIARVHRVLLQPQEHLPSRLWHVGIDGYALQRRWASLYQASSEDERPQVVAAYRKFSFRPEESAKRILADVRSTPLLRLADEVVRHHGRPRGEPVFLHGDVWPGNLLWIGDRCVGLIDWKEAGVGHPGVDLAYLRFSAAMHHGQDGPALVREGYEDEMGQGATDLAYWDALVALNTPTDEEQDGTTHSRDAFLRAAVDELL